MYDYGKTHYKWPCSIVMLNYQKVAGKWRRHHHGSKPPNPTFVAPTVLSCVLSILFLCPACKQPYAR